MHTIRSIGPEQIALLERLSNACAVSGDEAQVRDIVLEQIKGFADEVKVDALGMSWRVQEAKTQTAAGHARRAHGRSRLYDRR